MRRPLEIQTRHQALHIGAVCGVALVRDPRGRGTWRLDRIRKVVGYGQGREISEVESGVPVILYRRDVLNGQRHWFTYELNGDVRARELWDWWVTEGRPTFRTHRKAHEALARFMAPPA